MRSFFKTTKRLIVAAIGLALLGVIGIACYMVYVDSNCQKAKNYLIKRYDLEEKKLKSKKYIQYVYEDVTNCDQEWIKKCTDDENLSYQYIFEYKDDVTIVVSEDKKGQLSDDSTLTPVEEDSKDKDNTK